MQPPKVAVPYVHQAAGKQLAAPAPDLAWQHPKLWLLSGRLSVGTWLQQRWHVSSLPDCSNHAAHRWILCANLNTFPRDWIHSP